MVVPVLVAFGSGMPRSVKKVFLNGVHGYSIVWSISARCTYLTSLVKSNPGPEYTDAAAMLLQEV